jgi:tRNA uridine 5-carbamoylmethylation protein Kti12
MIGLPGSGKSYVADTIRIGREYDFNGWICSTDGVIDNIAEEYGLTYNDCFKDLIDFATKQYNRDVAMGVAEGCDIILDQTNLTAKSRARKLAAIPKSYKKVAVVVPTQITDPARWQKQLNRPGKTIPVDVINEMVTNFQYPTFAEGFDEIWTETTDSYGNLFLNKKTS